MLPARPAKIFRSRWTAALWAAGILWTAYDVAGAAPSHPATTANASTSEAVDATGEPVSADDLATLANVMKGN